MATTKRKFSNREKRLLLSATCLFYLKRSGQPLENYKLKQIPRQ